MTSLQIHRHGNSEGSDSEHGLTAVGLGDPCFALPCAKKGEQNRARELLALAGCVTDNTLEAIKDTEAKKSLEEPEGKGEQGWLLA